MTDTALMVVESQLQKAGLPTLPILARQLRVAKDSMNKYVSKYGIEPINTALGLVKDDHDLAFHQFVKLMDRFGLSHVVIGKCYEVRQLLSQTEKGNTVYPTSLSMLAWLCQSFQTFAEADAETMFETVLEIKRVFSDEYLATAITVVIREGNRTVACDIPTILEAIVNNRNQYID
jgi:hypothetical protein